MTRIISEVCDLLYVKIVFIVKHIIKNNRFKHQVCNTGKYCIQVRAWLCGIDDENGVSGLNAGYTDRYSIEHIESLGDIEPRGYGNALKLRSSSWCKPG